MVNVIPFQEIIRANQQIILTDVVLDLIIMKPIHLPHGDGHVAVIMEEEMILVQL
jgi:hypothetical protein